jgi:Ca2+-transporting ATPase
MHRRQIKTEAYRLPIEHILDDLDVTPDKGLSAAEVKQRRRLYGNNRLRRTKRKSVWTILLNQFNSVIVWLLTAATGLSFYFREWTQGAAILVVLAINSAIGFTTEFRAVRSMEALRRLSKVRAKVRRDGRVAEILAEEIVPGDAVVLESGDTRGIFGVWC